MSTSEQPNSVPSEPERPTVRFRQLCTVSKNTILALSDDGVIYRRQLTENAEEYVWERLLSVIPVQLEARPCTYPGCKTLFEVFPAGSDIPDQCYFHRDCMF
jgi:hypothetical protein